MMEAMPIERLTPERRRELTRTALIDAATELFAQRGFHATSLEEIAESAGFTRGAIYSNFKNKDDLLLAVVDRYNELLLSAFAEALERAAKEARVDRIAAALWKEMLGRDPYLTLLSLELHLHALRDPGFRSRLNEFNRRQRQSTAELIRAQSAREGIPLKVPAEDLADILWASTTGIQEFAALDDDLDRWGHLVEVFFGLLEDALRAPAAERPGKKR